jgi:hypothetical protein
MTSLYHLTVETQRLLANLYDHETGEVNPEVHDQLNALLPATNDKCIAVASYIKDMELDMAKLETMKQEIERRQAAYTKEMARTKNYLMTNMEQCKITEVKCPYFTLRIKKNPYGTEIVDESAIPSEWFRTKEIVKTERKPDKVAIKDHVLTTGEQIPGALVRQTKQLQILTDKL